MTCKISIIIPVYNEEENVKELHEKITTAVCGLEGGYEVIYVDDCSTDTSFDVLKSVKDENTKIIKFRRNYGQTAAMQAGINHSCGDIIIMMDADLQNDPADIQKLVEKYNQGFDLVSGWRKNRQDNCIRKIPSKIANFLISKCTGTGLHDTGCTLKAYNGEILRKINLFGDHHRFIPAIFSLYSNKIAEVEVNHLPRVHGKSKYNIFRVFRVIVDLLAISYWKRYRSKPMYFWGILSLISFCISLIALIFSAVCMFQVLLLSFLGLVTFSMFLCFSVLLYGIGLLFEGSLKVNLVLDKEHNYTIETIL